LTEAGERHFIQIREIREIRDQKQRKISFLTKNRLILLKIGEFYHF